MKSARDDRRVNSEGNKEAMIITINAANGSDKRRNIVISRATSRWIALCGIAMLGGFVALASLFIYTDTQLKRANLQLENAIARGDTLDEDMTRIATMAGELEVMIDTLTLDGDADSAAYANGSSSALPVRFDSRPNRQAQNNLEYVGAILQSAQIPFQNIIDALASQSKLLSDIPSVWPLQNDHGHVTLEFGPNRHPKTNQWYLHKGIDIAGAYGVRVLASASGKVVEAGYDGSGGYGNYILLRHKYGFRTRYSHLSAMYVVEGQDIAQGEAIGALGNTGISTGPHLDFQIILGTDVIDPVQFLQISRQQFQRWSGNR